MSRHEIEIEGLPEGYEPVKATYIGAALGKTETHTLALEIRRKVRKYDHSKTLDDVLVITSTEGMYRYRDKRDKTTGIAGVLQPNIHGRCPVDPEASIVRVMHLNGATFESLASDVNWAIGCEDDDVIAWQFLSLADGYEW